MDTCLRQCASGAVLSCDQRLRSCSSGRPEWRTNKPPPLLSPDPANISQNQMHEALMLFESIANSKYFEKSALILFLNKMDLFREKIQSGKAPIKEHFPDYYGDERDVEAGQEFFAQKFKNLVRDPAKEAYVHYTNATDTNLLDKTMKSVQDMIVQRNLHNLML